MFKRIVSTIIVCVLAAAFLSSCSFLESVSDKVSGNSESTKSPEQQREAWLVSVQNKNVEQMEGIETQKTVEWNENYTVWAAYPTVSGMDTINTELTDFANNKITLFKQEASGADVASLSEKPNFTLSYKPYDYADYSISFKFQTYSNSGKSVTDNYIETFVYNKADYSPITLSDIFTEGSDYLGTISSIVQEKLKKNSVLMNNYDEVRFQSGTSPDEANYSTFTIDSDKLIFYFNCQSIAPAAAGNFEVGVSFSELSDILTEEFKSGTFTIAPQTLENGTIPADQSSLPEFLKSPSDEFMSAHSLDGIDPINDKVIAFSFDDGPNPNTTPQLLDGLAELGVKVTFMVLGENASYYPDVVARAYNEGHEIGDHSYSHVDYKTVSNEEMVSEITKANDAIQAACGKRTLFGRAPYGSISEEMAQYTGRANILWDVDTLDWKYKDVDLDYDSIMSQVHDGALVLMHDIHQPSVTAALRAISDLKDEGYKFVTVSQLMQIAQIRGQELNYKFFGID